LIAPTLILAIGQRLVPKLCPNGKKEIPVTTAMKLMIEKDFSDLPEEFRKKLPIPEHVYEAAGGPGCPSGTKGRLAVYEFYSVNNAAQEIIVKKPNEVDVYKQARQSGMLTMKEDAMVKAFRGDIPYIEVNNL